MGKSTKKIAEPVVQVQGVGSGANSLSKEDLKKWAKNLVVFFAPAGIIFLLALQNGVGVKEALLPVYTWALSSAIDLLKKFSADNSL